LYIDDLPSATVVHKSINNHELDYFEGIPIGVYNALEDTYVIYNHLNITVYTVYTSDSQERIVGFEVEPMSFAEDEDRMLFDPSMSKQ
jgi:hypothetical protein